MALTDQARKYMTAFPTRTLVMWKGRRTEKHYGFREHFTSAGKFLFLGMKTFHEWEKSLSLLWYNSWEQHKVHLVTQHIYSCWISPNLRGFFFLNKWYLPKLLGIKFESVINDLKCRLTVKVIFLYFLRSSRPNTPVLLCQWCVSQG